MAMESGWGVPRAGPSIIDIDQNCPDAERARIIRIDIDQNYPDAERARIIRIHIE